MLYRESTLMAVTCVAHITDEYLDFRIDEMVPWWNVAQKYFLRKNFKHARKVFTILIEILEDPNVDRCMIEVAETQYKIHARRLEELIQEVK